MMTSVVSLCRQGNIAVITIDNPPVNALSQAVRQGIIEAMTQVNADPEVQAVVIACAGRTFVAGADIAEFGKPPLAPHLPEVMSAIEASAVPVVAALHGSVLGGGFELALACHYRVAIQGTKLGLPEVNLGLIPGAGGTQRLPRLIGVDRALEIITSGKPVAARSLTECGAIDQMMESNLLDSAIEFAAARVAQGDLPVPVSQRPVEEPENAQALFDQWRVKLARRARGQLAPQHAIQSIYHALQYDFDQALLKERELFIECKNSSQSSAMRHAFFAERAAAKVTGVNRKPMQIEQIAVIGAGTMGTGIAMCFASAGYRVYLLEVEAQNLQRGLDKIREDYQQLVDRGRISSEQMQQSVSLVQGTGCYEDLTDVDLVVEAAFENRQVKQAIFAKLDSLCKPSAILASNTSYLDINAIAGATERASQVLGMHFFSPAHVMKLLEVVRVDKTSDQTVVTVMALGKKIGKLAVAVGVCYGFVGNRMYSCYGREANMLLLEGASPAQIDRAMEAWGMAMGPLCVADLSGIDIGYKARRENPRPSTDPLFFRAADSLVEKQRLGRKSGLGFYRYQQGKKLDDPEVEKLIRSEAQQLGVRQREIDDQEIQDRLIFALINEGARILDEGIATRASDIDVIWLNGYGFPRFRGGPMCYADQLGLKAVLARIEGFQKMFAKHYWQPAPLLKELADKGQQLSTWNRH